MHDIAYDPGKETRRVEVDDYRNNLIETIEIVQRHGIKVIWVNTTPVDDERHNARAAFKRHNRNVLLYNEIAAEIMRERDIPVIDLYSFTDALEGEKYIDHVHFLGEVSEKQAAFLARELEKLIP